MLGLCPDPTNQLRIDAGSDPVGEVEALPVDMIKTIHFKQTRGGEAIPTVDSGDVDCLRQLKALRDKGYTRVRRLWRFRRTRMCLRICRRVSPTSAPS